jgi:hypothetical protein
LFTEDNENFIAPKKSDVYNRLPLRLLNEGAEVLYGIVSKLVEKNSQNEICQNNEKLPKSFREITRPV